MQKNFNPEAIKNNILRLLQTRNWSITDLERKIGHRCVTNIIHGKSKNPTIDLLTRIASAFNVEIQEIIYEYDVDKDEKVDYPLLLECFVQITNVITSYESDYNINSYNILFLSNELYKYSRKLNIRYIDKEFTQWVIGKYYKKPD